MNNEYLARAKERIPDAKTLIILASKRAYDLAHRKKHPMVRTKDDNYLDIALLEIAEGLLDVTFADKVEDDFLKQAEALKMAAEAEKPAPREQ